MFREIRTQSTCYVPNCKYIDYFTLFVCDKEPVYEAVAHFSV